MESEAIAAFRRLFVPPGKRHGAQDGAGWRTVHEPVSDDDLRAHLQGGPVIGVTPAHRRGAAWAAGFIALEVDIATGDLCRRDLVAAREQVLGFDGHRAWAAVRAASEDLGIPAAYWTGAYSGRRSLHLWLLPEDLLPLVDAHAIARALVAGAAERGVPVCTACPTSPDGWGMLFRLPWGRHPQGAQGHLVDLGLWELNARPPYPTDAQALGIIANRRVPHENLQVAADIARARRPPAVSLGGAPPEDTPKVHLPDTDLRITRPCIAGLIQRGVPENHRHEVALLLRSELKAAGFTVEEALPVVARYARACDPPWDLAEAEYDLSHNWATTDPAKRHVCPGAHGSRLTRYLHERECVGGARCAAHRLGLFTCLWGPHLSGNAKALYAALCTLEVGFARRPGDEVHTTVAQLRDTAHLVEYAFKAARRELEDAGLVTHRRLSKGRGHGVHSVYRRAIPMPLPEAGFHWEAAAQGSVNGARSRRV